MKTTKPDNTVRPVSFATAKRRLGNKDRVKLDRNTYLERRSDNCIAVILHATDIVTYAPTYTELNSGGWHTMTTRSRMEDYIPMAIRADKTGWHLFPPVEMPCLCVSDGDKREQESWSGVVIQGAWSPGLALHFTGLRDEDDKPIYIYGECFTCKGTGTRIGPDWDSGGYVYFDGIRINPTGKRLMVRQPNAPKGIAEPVVTVSGWSGTTRARRMGEPFADLSR